MLLDLKRLFASEGEVVDIDYTLAAAQSDLTGTVPDPVEIHLKGVAQNRAQIVEIRFGAHFTVNSVCDRCLEPLTRVFDYQFTHVLTQEVIDGFEEDIIVDGDKLNLDRLALTDIQLEFPLKLLCCEDCKGLCPQCGANLNRESCNCDKDPIDPRLEALKELLQ